MGDRPNLGRGGMSGKSSPRKGYPAREVFYYLHDRVGATEMWRLRDLLRVTTDKWWGLDERLQAQRLNDFPALLSPNLAIQSLTPQPLRWGTAPLILKHRSD